MKPLLITLLLTFTVTSCSKYPCKQNLCCPEPGHGDFCPICGVAIPPNDNE